jgi:hypothetical protein
MVDLSGIVSTLELKRQELLQELDAVDQAIAALRSAPARDVRVENAENRQPAAAPAEPLIPTRVRARRVLGEAHKQALTMGRRKARQAKDAAAGHAREMPDDSFVPALAARGTDQLPRLVKKPRK